MKGLAGGAGPKQRNAVVLKKVQTCFNYGQVEKQDRSECEHETGSRNGAETSVDVKQEVKQPGSLLHFWLLVATYNSNTHYLHHMSVRGINHFQKRFCYFAIISVFVLDFGTRL